MMYRLVSLLLLLSSTFFVALAEQSDYYNKVDEADTACRESRWADAAMALEGAMAIDPDNSGNIMLMSNLGMVRYHMGDIPSAISTLTGAHRMAPSSVTILSNRAQIYMESGRFTDAYSDYGLIMRLDSTDVTSRLRHGIIALQSGDVRTASDDFNYLWTRYPSSTEALTGMATLYSATGDYQKALPFYNDLLREARDVEYLTGRALCYLMTDNLQEASDDIAEALEKGPDDGELYLYRAALNKMRFLPQDADADARKAMSLGVDPARVRQFLVK